MNFGGAVRLNPLGLCIIICGVLFVTYFYYHTNTIKAVDPSQIHLKKLLATAIDVAEKGGRQVKLVRAQVDLHAESKGETKEGVNDLVTEGDMKSHVEMYYGLKRAYPSVTIISEEHNNIDESTKVEYPSEKNEQVDKIIKDDIVVAADDITVWIDPLDATKEYTENLLQYVTTMVCVTVKGKPLIGVIHKPFEDKTYWGWVDKGVSPGLETKESDKADDKLGIIVSISHAGEVEKKAQEAFGDNIQIIKAAGAGYKVLEVVKGNADMYLHWTGIKKWDICAGNAILNALHGQMSTLRGQEITYNPPHVVEDGILAALENHDQYLLKLKKLNAT